MGKNGLFWKLGYVRIGDILNVNYGTNNVKLLRLHIGVECGDFLSQMWCSVGAADHHDGKCCFSAMERWLEDNTNARSY